MEKGENKRVIGAVKHFIIASEKWWCYSVGYILVCFETEIDVGLESQLDSHCCTWF